MSAWRVNADVPEVPFGGGRFKVLIGNESGKININSAGADLLRLGLNSVGLSDGEKETIVDSILDWRDEDNFHRANGAEDDYYRSLPRPYECKDGEFDSVDELLLVRGVTAEIFFDGLKNRFTVYGGDGSANPNRNWRMRRKQSSQININAAPPDVLMALPMMTQEAVDAIVEFRMEEEIKSVSDLADLVGADIYNAIKTHITFSNSPFYTVLSTGMLAGSSTRVGLEALVEINGTYEGGFRIVEWRETPDPDRLASAEDSEGEAAEQGWSQEGSTFIRF
jgi:general secretion pathway protein K